MNVLLLVVTVASLALAITMTVVARRATADERRRAAARVAALTAAAGVGTRPEPAGLDLDASRPALDAFAAERPHDEVPLQASFLGAGPQTVEVSSQRTLAAAAAVLAVALGGFAYSRLDSRPAPPPTSITAPLELLSLRHEREGTNLAVAGLVRNPEAAGLVERLSAVVLLFDAQGAFVSSATAPIDFLKLTAGDESPFVVKVQAPASVARYRVSFRTDDGTLPHVDRRAESPGASPVTLAR
jgi:hypothetical protein